MKVAVIALGKIGLPLAVHYARMGHHIVGVDIDERTVDAINGGIAPFPGEAQLDSFLKLVIDQRRLTATTDYSEAVPSADVVVVVVPLIIDSAGDPDFASMDSATDSIGNCLTPGTLVIYETTLPVGTTRSRWKPMLERRSGLLEGTDFHLAFSPERVLTGRVFEDLRKYPKLVGALSVEGTARVIDFYERALAFDNRDDLGARSNGVWDLGSPEAAEMAKLAETTYRDVNIGLANQFAQFAEQNGIDMHAVIDAANSQPYSNIHRPGISVGGHCIPVYPRLYLSNDPHATVVQAARAVNASMPAHGVALLRKAYGDLSDVKVTVLGAAYRGGVKETAFSGVFPLVGALKDAGARPVVHDPMYSDDELIELGFLPYSLGTPTDAVILHTDHLQYKSLRPDQLPGAKVVVDGRNILQARMWSDFGLLVIGEGRTLPSSSKKFS